METFGASGLLNSGQGYPHGPKGSQGFSINSLINPTAVHPPEYDYVYASSGGMPLSGTSSCFEKMCVDPKNMYFNPGARFLDSQDNQPQRCPVGPAMGMGDVTGCRPIAASRFADDDISDQKSEASDSEQVPTCSSSSHGKFQYSL